MSGVPFGDVAPAAGGGSSGPTSSAAANPISGITGSRDRTSTRDTRSGTSGGLNTVVGASAASVNIGGGGVLSWVVVLVVLVLLGFALYWFFLRGR